MDLTLASSDHALYPLLHFVLDDLPTSTKSARLDDSNTRAICEAEINERGTSGLILRCPNVKDLMSLYLGYFMSVGFIEKCQGAEWKEEWKNAVSAGIRRRD